MISTALAVGKLLISGGFYGLPKLKLTTASKGIVLYHNCADSNLENMVLYAPDSSHWAVIYSSAILTTLLWCTVLIVYHILSVIIELCLYMILIEIMVEICLSLFRGDNHSVGSRRS